MLLKVKLNNTKSRQEKKTFFSQGSHLQSRLEGDLFLHITWDKVVIMHRLFECMHVFMCLRASAVWWGKWMMDDRQKSYVIAPSALMVLGRCTPLPDPDLLPRMTQRFCTLTFALYIPIFSSSLTIGTAGSIPPYPHWLCVLLNIAFCSRPAHCTEICIIYRWGTDSLLSGGFIWGNGGGDLNIAYTNRSEGVLL